MAKDKNTWPSITTTTVTSLTSDWGLCFTVFRWRGVPRRIMTALIRQSYVFLHSLSLSDYACLLGHTLSDVTHFWRTLLINTLHTVRHGSSSSTELWTQSITPQGFNEVTATYCAVLYTVSWISTISKGLTPKPEIYISGFWTLFKCLVFFQNSNVVGVWLSGTIRITCIQ